jgi:hypothetical protein
MQAPDIEIKLNSGGFGPADGEVLAERLRTETRLRVESDLFDYYSEGDPFPPGVILSIFYTLLPLREIYANMLSSMLREAAKATHERSGRRRSRATFFVRKVVEEGRTLKEVRGLTTDPKIIKDIRAWCRAGVTTPLIRRPSRLSPPQDQ